MTNLIGIIVGALLALASCSAYAGEVLRERVLSNVLKRNIPYSVYVPDNYTSGLQRYPVLYLLHGAGGDELDWSTYGRVKETADRLIAEGTIPPALIVMPGCLACWWVDGARDKAETAFWTEFVPAIDANYRTIKSRDGRFIGGLSAGGYGAVRFGLKYPDRVGAVAAMSPAVYTNAPPALSSARLQPPFLRPDGTFNDAKWHALNYPSLLPAYAAQRYRVPMFLMSGDGDKLGIAFETALLHKRLFELQPELAELRVLDGDHTWSTWSRGLAEAMTFVFRYSAPRVTMAGAKPGPAAVTHALKPE